MQDATLWFFALLGASFLVKTAGLLKTGVLVCSLFAFLFFIFVVFEFFPSLVPPALKIIPYYALRTCCVADPRLVYRYKPIPNLRPYISNRPRGRHYSPVYRADAPIMTFVPRSTQRDGLSDSNDSTADVVVIGDSFVQFALKNEDTFGAKLEKISGLNVVAFGAARYGPFQYLEVLKTHGVKKRPKYALFSFFEGNDLDDVQNYLEWREADRSKNGTAGGYYGVYHLALSGTLSDRFALALTQTNRYLAESLRSVAQLAIDTIAVGKRNHPDIAVINLGDQSHKVLFTYKNDARTPDELLRSSEWRKLREIMIQLRNVSLENDTIPIVMYVPTVAHIYAEYSTWESGQNWLNMRAAQITAKANRERAMISLCRELDISLLNLSRAFEASAREGKLLYYPFDNHWNSEGREVAAGFVSEALKKQESRGAHYSNSPAASK
ncbi:MAG: alginate O-acetyltransferase AlgX-related protein [Candidatus Binatia bacterium]